MFWPQSFLGYEKLLIEFRSLLDSKLSKGSEFSGQYYTEALNYFNRFCKEIFAHLDDGELPIENNLAKRTNSKTDYSTQQFTAI